MTEQKQPFIDRDASTADTPQREILDHIESAPSEQRFMPRKIGHYTIKSFIGSGGMALVYLAVQEHPRRKVALKLMKSGIASRSALRRFDFESQILGRLRHPNIAQVYEAGTHGSGEGGVPYFAMEYIPGAMPITEYARKKGLSTRQRLELFGKVCDAVHHGHQKGIIHRDLKPGNILVDSNGEPKVIDFGVARSTDSDMAVTTLQTDVGQLIGTLQYMSPEQCEADPDDLDTRSDVYALGVVLYELLCEQLPYDVTKVAVFEAAQVVREQVPPKPSTINRTVRGDVETIALKALEKERDRRYKSAEALSDDIHKYLMNEPIQARPPSLTYQLKMLARRHRTAFGAAVTVMTMLAVATIVSSLFLIQANIARNELKIEVEQRRRAEQDADEARGRAEAEAENAREINDFLTQDLLAAVAPSSESGRGRDVLMRDVLDEAAKRIEDPSALGGRFADKPLIEASIRMAIGDTYRLLGEYQAAEPHLEHALQLRERVLGEEHLVTVSSMNSLANLYQVQGRYDKAALLYVKTLETSQRVLGEEHPHTLSFMSNLAHLYANQGRLDEAEQLQVRALDSRTRALGEEHKDTLSSMNNLAILYQRLGRYAEAEHLHVKALDIRKRVLGEDDPETVDSMNNLAIVYFSQGRYDKAEPLWVRTQAIRERLLGKEHPVTLKSSLNLANLYYGQARYDEAEPLFLKTLEISKRVIGDEHPNTLLGMANLAELYLDQNRFRDAAALIEAAVAGAERVLGEKHWLTGVFSGTYGRTLAGMHRYEEAESALRKAFESLTTVLGPNHKRSIEQIDSLIALYLAWDESNPDQGYDVKAAEWQAKLAEVEPSGVAEGQE
ncbi:MAG: serine/threonine protein kinase [Phycisphaerales bacterium]|nr:MAG: serine/threonine protein kinase [Phycisphaerales bacterium]